MGLSDTSITVNESKGVVEVCLTVHRPNVDCPVMFEFRVILTTTPGTAGIIAMCMRSGSAMSDSTKVQTSQGSAYLLWHGYIYISWYYLWLLDC